MTQQKQAYDISYQYKPTSRNKKNFQINNLSLHIKELEKEQRPKWQGEGNNKDQNENKQNSLKNQKINETKICFFERINKINNPLATLIQERERENPHN